MKVMKKIARIMTLVAMLATQSCTSSKQVMPVTPEQPQKSYRLPACHKAVHEELLRSQYKFIPSAVKLNLTNVVEGKEEEL